MSSFVIGGDGARSFELPSGGSAAAGAGAADAAGAGTDVGGGAAEAEEEMDPRYAPGLRIEVHAMGQKYVMKVGLGLQSVRWLALASVQRVMKAQQLGQTVGFVGTRKPTQVATLEGVVVNPNRRVVDLCEAWTGDGIPKVQLSMNAHSGAGDEPELTDTGELPQTTWAAEAYNYSAKGRERTRRKLEEEAAIKEMARLKAAEAAAAERAAKYERLTKAMAVGTDDDDAFADLVESDWEFVRFDEITHDEDAHRAMKKILLKRYVAIVDIYQHFSGGSNTGALDSMSQKEWQFFLMELPGGMYNMARESKEADNIFLISGVRVGEDEEGRESLSRFEFMEALIRFAVYKFGTAKRPGEPYLSPDRATSKLIEDFLVPTAAKLGMADVRKALGSAQVKTWVREHTADLKGVFAYWRAADASNGPRQSKIKRDDAAMNLNELCACLLKAELLNDARHPAKTSSEQLTITEVRRAFSGVQRDSADALVLDEGAGQELNLQEFIEVLARIANEKWEGSRIKMTLEEKIVKAAEMVLGTVGDEERAKLAALLDAEAA